MLRWAEQQQNKRFYIFRSYNMMIDKWTRMFTVNRKNLIKYKDETNDIKQFIVHHGIKILLSMTQHSENSVSNILLEIGGSHDGLGHIKCISYDGYTPMDIRLYSSSYGNSLYVDVKHESGYNTHPIVDYQLECNVVVLSDATLEWICKPVGDGIDEVPELPENNNISYDYKLIENVHIDATYNSVNNDVTSWKLLYSKSINETETESIKLPDKYTELLVPTKYTDHYGDPSTAQFPNVSVYPRQLVEQGIQILISDTQTGSTNDSIVYKYNKETHSLDIVTNNASMTVYFYYR